MQECIDGVKYLAIGLIILGLQLSNSFFIYMAAGAFITLGISIHWMLFQTAREYKKYETEMEAEHARTRKQIAESEALLQRINGKDYQ